MLKKRAWTFIIAGLLLLGTLQAWATLTKNFEAQGADVQEGWSWLRETGAAATWDLGALPAGEMPSNTRACEVQIKALIAPGGDAAPGHEKHMTLKMESGGYAYIFSVVLEDGQAVLGQKNLSRGTDRVALKRLCRTYAETGSLQVSYAYRPTREACCRNNPDYPHHVGVKADSVEVVYQ